MRTNSINSIIFVIFLLITCSFSLNLKTHNLDRTEVTQGTCYVQLSKGSCESKTGCFWRLNNLGGLKYGCHATQLPK